MILVTGASGKTGQAIIKALAARGETSRAFIRRGEYLETVKLAGAQESVVGDMRDEVALLQAAQGVQAIYHICPNVSPVEVPMGQAVVAAAVGAGVNRFVFHSVLHPQAEAMPHHWQKLRVEEMLLAAGLSFTILQPTAYMQNLLAGWKTIVEAGVVRSPYPVETRLSLIDLEDVAEAAAIVLTEPGHTGATYELVGTPPLTQTEVAQIFSEALGRPVRAESESIEAWEARNAGLSEYQRATLVKMFRYYAHHGLIGNPNSLRWLLGREPNSLAHFARWVARGDEPRSRQPRYCEG